MTCLDCKHCDVKHDSIKYTFVDGSTYVCFQCKKYGETPLINVDNPEEICCKDLEVEENESS